MRKKTKIILDRCQGFLYDADNTHNKANTTNQGEEKMKNYTNIDKSFFHPGEYVGYGAGKVWKIQRYAKGWQATAKFDYNYKLVEGANLQEISARLEIVDKHMKGKNNS